MNYTPVFENVLPEGEYFFKIMNANEFTAKTGRHMLKINLLAWKDNDTKSNLDYVFPLENFGFLRNVAKAIGELERYENQQLECKHLKDKTGKCEIGIKENALYESENIVKKMLPKDKEEVPSVPVPDNFDDSIPF